MLTLLVTLHPLIQDIRPHGILGPPVHHRTLVKEPPVLEDQHASRLGVDVDSRVAPTREERRCAADEIGLGVIRGGVVKVELDGVEGHELRLAGFVLVVIRAVTVCWGDVSMGAFIYRGKGEGLRLKYWPGEYLRNLIRSLMRRNSHCPGP